MPTRGSDNFMTVGGREVEVEGEGRFSSLLIDKKAREQDSAEKIGTFMGGIGSVILKKWPEPTFRSESEIKTGSSA